MLGLVVSTAFCYAFDENKTGKENLQDGIPIQVRQHNNHNDPDRGSSISAFVDGHYLTIAFTENIGQVLVEVTSVPGGNLETDVVRTPDGMQYYLPLAGDYIVSFTLSNGDEYYGEFTITD